MSGYLVTISLKTLPNVSIRYRLKTVQDYDNDDVETEVILDNGNIILICRGKDNWNKHLR